MVERMVSRAGEMVMWFAPSKERISGTEVREAGMVFVGEWWERR